MQRWNIVLCSLAFAFAATACSDLTSGTDGKIDIGGIHDMAVTDGTTPPAPYMYVKIEDLHPVTGAQDGADIDAVELIKAGTTTSTWASSVASCTYPDGTTCANANKATGPSDAFCTDPTKCYSNYEEPTDDPATLPPYVSLGGLVGGVSGTLILQMASPIANGDQLIVYEVGNCTVSSACGVASTTNATAESVKVSVAKSATGPWTVVLAASDTTKHPDIDITIAGLP